MSTFQDQVAAAMDQHAEAFKPEFILSLGDNFYPNGIDSIEDPKINRCVCVCVCVCIYIYIYIVRERERERERIYVLSKG